MNIAGAKIVLDRIARLSRRATNVGGDGATWSYTFPDDVKTTYILNEVKAQEELGDDILNVFIWFWSFKDYLKELIVHQGGDPSSIENKVNSDQKLAICADIANRLKHSSLNHSRSGKFPILGSLAYSIPQSSIKKISFRGDEVEFDFQDYENIDIKMPILDSSGNEIGQALHFLSYAIDVWEKEFAACDIV
ncbi:MAG TPA: hypothetical protein ENH82_01100 [bacterium]|nr:hypothetical protein [bacterium]